MKEVDGRVRQLWVVPPTPDRQRHLEMILDILLDRKVKETLADRSIMYAGFADTKPITEDLPRLYLQLNPETWRPLFREWAGRRMKESSRDDIRDTTTYEALSSFLEEVERADGFASLSPDDADEQARELPSTAVQNYHELAPERIRLVLRGVPRPAGAGWH